MYKNFFGFKERPFQLVPNPAYLFLSRSHEEAMAHLTYAISQGDGFVEITGEVGTGKTTLCRAFLENLDQNTEAAYIFNPKLDSIQLLKAINDEFGIRSEADNSKDLIDVLNSFLIKKKAEGKKVILLIDEAQNLNKEVLEQLRLLSNLETTTSKLLQIILVGQPELGEMLDSHDLRQLGQRITLSCNLNPLTFKETREYIRHRIQIASQKPGMGFTHSAFRSIYRYSGGIPRLINIVCDRALLTSFGLNRHKITGSIASASIRELAGRGEIRRYSLKERKKAIMLLSALCLILFFIILYHPGDLVINNIFKSVEGKRLEVPPSRHSEVKIPISALPEKKQGNDQEKSALDQKPVNDDSQEKREAEPDIKPVLSFTDYLKDMNTRSSRRMALKTTMDLWGAGSDINRFLDNMDDDQAFFRLAARQNGLLIHRIKGDLNLVKKLNLPAILEIYPPEGLSPRYLTISKIDERGIILTGGAENDVIAVEPDQVESYWSGVAYIPWNNFLDYTGIIPANAPRDSIITLKMLMLDIGYDEIEISPFYDEKTRDAVKEIQERHGLTIDGIVGPLTKIVLYNEKKSLKIPHIID